MMKHGLSRREFIGAVAAVGLGASNDGWVDLFNGRNLEGWKSGGSRDSWMVDGGLLSGGGAASHLFYNGPVRGARFRNFELEIDAMARPLCNAGIYFHTAYQEGAFPKKGLKVHISSTSARRDERHGWYKTGSLCGLRGIYKQFVPDNQWYKLRLSVRGKNIQVRLNDLLLVDYTEPTPPVLPRGADGRLHLDGGTFALESDGEESVVPFRKVRVRPLPDDVVTPAAPPVVDDAFKRIIHMTAQGYPMVDYHVHVVKENIEQVMAQTLRDGIEYGVATNGGLNFPIMNDDTALAFVESMKARPVFIAMQAEGREWTHMFTRRSTSAFDYVFTDSMTWTDDSGKRMLTYIPRDVGSITDPQAFMEMLIARILGILNQEPIDIYVNPTYVPEVIGKEYDRLWTDERMKKVADAAVHNNVAIELNDSRSLPSAAFVRVFKKAGCKFTFGTNNVYVEKLPLRRSDYAMRMIDECGLGPQDFWVPGGFWPRAFERKPDGLHA